MMKFPFLWGTATSAHQVEGANTLNDWWEWETLVRTAHPSGNACDHYHRFEDDIRTISELGHTAHRFSIEWSRIEPRENEFSEDAFLHYEKVLQTLREKKIEPVVTLHHFTNPLWFSKKGGWESEQSIDFFARYVRKVTERLGHLVRIWITINEPVVYVYYSYLTGEWPPGKQDFTQALRVLRNMIYAHSWIYPVIHDYYETQLKSPVWVSIAKHLIDFQPYRKYHALDWLATSLRRRFMNQMVLDACVSGKLCFPGIYRESLPSKKALDFIGVNYYTRHRIRFCGWKGAELLGQAHEPDDEELKQGEYSSLDWEICPQGLYQVLRDLKKYRLPLVICENGIASDDDEQRCRFIESHIEAVQKARQEAIPVRGYLYWSQFDNFEWKHGYVPKFGIQAVDLENFERKMKRSAYVLSDLCRKL